MAFRAFDRLPIIEWAPYGINIRRHLNRKCQIRKDNKMKYIIYRAFFIMCIIAVTASISIAGGTIIWEEESFEDFEDGRLDAAGQNIYVSRDGKIRTIFRFDINNDGYLDLFFGNTHDLQFMVPPTVCTVTPNQGIKQEELSVRGSDKVKSADLNRDGFMDLVFALNGDGIHSSRKFVEIVYGGRDGWPAQRTTGHLPAYHPVDLAVADLNADKWPDIVVLQLGNVIASKQKTEFYVTVYWGGKDGFLLSRYQDIITPQAIKLAASDFDNDSSTDIAVLTSEGKIKIFWAKDSDMPVKFKTSDISLKSDTITTLTVADYNCDGNKDLVVGSEEGKLYLIKSSKKRKWQKPKTIDCVPATHITCSDLDKDGFNDLLLTYFNIARAGGGEAAGAGADIPDFVTILWGDKKGFSKDRITKLASKNAFATAIEDLDNDGHKDIAIAVYQSEKTFQAESLIYFGSGNREFKLSSQKIKTRGATDLVIIPEQNNLNARIVFANSVGGSLNEEVPVYVYWGAANGFDPNNRWEIPCRSGHKAIAVDLNADGFTDFVPMVTVHGGLASANAKNIKLGAYIYWGGPNGFDLQNCSIIEDSWQFENNTADLNRDGYLDLVLSGNDAWEGPKTGSPATISIYYGSAGGFDPNNKTSLETKGGGHNPIIADFNKDSWLDIAANSSGEDCARIFWGSPQGFNVKNQQKLPVPSTSAGECADLNADGFLDLIVTSYYDKLTGSFDTGNYIFWGSSDGFSYSNAQWLPGSTNTFHAVADFDNDGFLDTFCPSYHGQLSRENILSPLYWGGPDGFSPKRKTLLLCNSACGAQAGDFNRDGLIDLAVSNHTIHGDHKTDSKVFYNDGNRFSNPRIQNLPTLGSHFMYVGDMGHIYNRSYEQQYESSVFSYDQPVETGQLTYNAAMPEGTELVFFVRSAPCKKDIVKSAWQYVESGTFSLKSEDRCLQYKAGFKSDNGDRFPVLDSVKVELTGKL